MPRNFARHEQFLRIFALLESLSVARQPVDDQTLIATLKERLGLKHLSARTIHRDCDFLAACGYPVDHVPLAGNRRQGWLLDREALAARKIPAEPLTLLELVAFSIGRNLLRPFEGTVLWTGIESLRHKLEQSLPPQMLDRLGAARGVFHVRGECPSRYGSRPRLISALSTASSHRLRPLRLVIEPPRVRLLAFEAVDDAPAVLIDLDRIETVATLDATFEPPVLDTAAAIGRAVTRP